MEKLLFNNDYKHFKGQEKSQQNKSLNLEKNLKENFNKKATTITYEKGQKILLNNPIFTNKNKKFTDK